MGISSYSPEEKRAYMLEWRAKNADRIRRYKKEYEKANPEKKKLNQKRYYDTKVKTDPVRMDERRKYRAARDKANPEKHAERCKRWSESHRELLAERARVAYHAKSPEERKQLRESRAEYQKQWRAEHKESIREYGCEYRKNNVDDLKVKARERYAKDKVAYIQRANKRRALLTGTYTGRDIEVLYVEQCGQCRGCRQELNGKYEIDHIMPLSLDPSGDRLDNLQLLCRPCNRSKHALHPDVWNARIGKVPCS